MNGQGPDRAAAGDGVKGANKRSGQIGPGRATVCRLKNSSPGVTIQIIVVLTRAGVDDVVVRRINGDGADGKANLSIGEWSPVGTAVCRLPHAAIGPASIDDVGVRRIDS